MMTWKSYTVVLTALVAAIALAGCRQNTARAPQPAPPAISSQADTVRLSQKEAADRRLDHRFPPYPVKAKQAHEEGAVTFTAIIGRDGHVRSLELAKADFPSLTEAAEKSVQNWVYKPYLVDGKPVEVETTITVRFTLGSGDN
ncbi:MAG TPA: energy transducer TonB [Pseudomonas sp.]|uniref:energy transducer TonB n=1 Tax=Pseudomonas sp. TaxID=306 RepID=UPI002ED817F0